MILDDLFENDNSFNKTLAAIEEKNKDLENQKRELLSFKEEVLAQKNKLYSELSKYSTFNVDSIGTAIAKLLTAEEEEKYKYITCVLKAKMYAGYDYITKQNEYIMKEIPVKIILKEEHTIFLKEPIDIEVFRKLIELDIPFIVIDRNETGKLAENINIYDRELNLNINKPFWYKKEAIHYFDIPELEPFHNLVIKDYIDKVVNYRIENKIDDISDEELYELINSKEKKQKYIEISEENEKTLKKEKR